MSHTNSPSSSVLFHQDNVKSILPLTTDVIKCNLTIYENKTIQILKQRQIQTSKNYNSPNLLKLRQIINIDLTLLYSVNLIENTLNSQEEENRKSFQPNLIITNLQNNQQYTFQINIFQCRLEKIKRFFSLYSWFFDNILEKYEVVHQVSNKYLNLHEKKRRFAVLKDTETFKNYFVKLYKKSSFLQSGSRKLNISSIVHEVTFQNLIKNRHILRYSKFFEDGQYFYLFFQQKPTKLFSQYLEECKELSSGKVRSIMRQLLKVISVLSESQISHNNIKPQSIFVIQNNEGWKVCLGEFQHACHGIESMTQYKSYVQKQVSHLAPQLLWENQFYGEFNQFNSDIFSLGIILHQMLFRKQLYTPEVTLKDRNQNLQIDFNDNRYQQLSTNCLDFYRSVIEFDPNFRITPKQALHHNFFTIPQQLTESITQKSYNSFNTLRSYDTLMERDTLKKIETQNKRLRNRYYETFPIKKFLPLTQESRKLKTEKSSKQVTINSDEEVLFEKNIKEKYFEALIDDMQMDDSHNKLKPRDVRSMKPAIIFRNRK